MTRAVHTLSVIAVACLFTAIWLPWLDDEAGRTAGPLLFTGRDSGAGLTWVRITVVVTAVAFVLGTVTVARHWRADTIETVARCAAWAATFCGLGAILAVASTLHLGSRAGRGLLTTAVLAAAATLVLTITAYTHRRRPYTPADDPPHRDAGVLFARRHVVFAAIVLAVGAIATPLGARWWVSWRHVDATTTSGPDSVLPPSGPDAPRKIAWSRPADGAIAAGPYVVLLGDGDGASNPGEGIVVVDASTGHERWHYRRDDGPVDNVVVDTSDNLLVASVELDERHLYEIVALDLTTGDRRWSRRTSAEAVAAGDGGILLQQNESHVVLGWSARDGSDTWRRSVRGQCYRNMTTTTTMFIAGPGCAHTDDDVAVGRSLRTGKAIWSHRFPASTDIASIDDAVQVGHTVVLHVDGWWSAPGHREPEGLLAFDSTSGTQLWRHRSAHPEGMTWMKGLVLLNDERIRALDARTGRAAWTVSPPVGHHTYDLGSDHHTRGYAMAQTKKRVKITTFDASGTPLHTTSIRTCLKTKCRNTHDLGGSATIGGVADTSLLTISAPYVVLAHELSRVAALR